MKLLVYFATVVAQIQYAIGTIRLSPKHIKALSSLYHSHLRSITNTLHPWAAIKTGYPPVNDTKVRHKANAPTLESIYQLNVHKHFVRTISTPMHDLRHKFDFTTPLNPTRLHRCYEGRGKKHGVWTKFAVSLEQDIVAKYVTNTPTQPRAAYDKLFDLVQNDIPTLYSAGKRVRRLPRVRTRPHRRGVPPDSEVARQSNR